MSWIKNISYGDLVAGNHNKSQVVISILDAGYQPIYSPLGGEHHHFWFQDCAEGPGAITISQAQSIAEILKRAYAAHHNVIVQCHMGICRSGAVVEAAALYGFNTFTQNKNPNILVKNLVRRSLGILNSWENP